MRMRHEKRVREIVRRLLVAKFQVQRAQGKIERVLDILHTHTFITQCSSHIIKRQATKKVKKNNNILKQYIIFYVRFTRRVKGWVWKVAGGTGSW